ncbi:wall-associated receptor kinase 3 [Hordeum vulgare]|nr:wall-associated receptor kinase 3 [Hordeum vulgare]
MSLTRGVWDGSNIDEEHIDVLRHLRMLPSASLFAARVPREENSPDPREGEVVVFAEHFTRGIGLPARCYFARFLTHYGMQPHHLAANVVLQLSAFVTLCEGF